MQTTCTGIFIDNMIRLDAPVDWPSGQAVEVMVVPKERKTEFSPEENAFLDELMLSRSESKIWNNKVNG